MGILLPGNTSSGNGVRSQRGAAHSVSNAEGDEWQGTDDAIQQGISSIVSNHTHLLHPTTATIQNRYLYYHVHFPVHSPVRVSVPTATIAMK